jgi:hypothetical protein
VTFVEFTIENCTAPSTATCPVVVAVSASPKPYLLVNVGGALGDGTLFVSFSFEINCPGMGEPSGCKYANAGGFAVRGSATAPEIRSENMILAKLPGGANCQNVGGSWLALYPLVKPAGAMFVTER